jgi:nucleoid-associated protein YgaU
MGTSILLWHFLLMPVYIVPPGRALPQLSYLHYVYRLPGLIRQGAKNHRIKDDREETKSLRVGTSGGAPIASEGHTKPKPPTRQLPYYVSISQLENAA